jgi:hypothetical protein
MQRAGILVIYRINYQRIATLICEKFHTYLKEKHVIKTLFIHQLMHQWVVLKAILKFALKFTLKQLRHVSVQLHTPSSGSVLIRAY